MGSLRNKRVLLGVTGGIAAYKSAELIRCLQGDGAQVRVVMTPAATEFITPLTLQALSGNPVSLELLDTAAEAAMGHIELARWADLILIAPASANFIARLCHGEGNDLLSTVCLASHSAIAVAPAMNKHMWENSATQKNLQQLREQAVHIFGPAAGYQACGDIGEGRMEDPAALSTMASALFSTGLLSGKKVVITAGPTREALDPVRYISNHSSGKMGYALARAATEAGANTVLISGPVQLEPPERIKIIAVESAADMLSATLEEVEGADIFIAAAAVADYRPASVAEQKIKKNDDDMYIQLVKNPDIVATVAALAERPLTVGFAAETENLEHYATQKLHKKNLDLVIANDVSDATIGFNSEDNRVLLVQPGTSKALPTMNKSLLATKLIEHIAALLSSSKLKTSQS
ncbi:MAG: bifunctional phosphopantothenoylcysteine decarboxylase/phosphopantothenate--cysteine ligase CoaBC [Gammaproteobacteria bacterium]|nr:bifunctional phosphopantothenoylcysteine decarboxylase/phosphopantothenate--cysteine ligase CoaBC [Gammaproteobacteria bacterium]MBQ0839101.1 bifunctional phosphopantothenoylcysteine decarboxylase/phosphopantothenate--cysteine ligase CoaBC [Gammaproteobacteria bacterium]